jgi:hypothetical protein
LRAAGIQFLRYADDFLVLARTPFELSEHREVVQRTLAELHLSLSDEKTRTTTFEQCFRFLGAEIQDDAILLPFEKKKDPKSPVWVAPAMPPAILTAYRQRRMDAVEAFAWSGEAKQPPRAAPAPARDKRLDALRRVPS